MKGWMYAAAIVAAIVMAGPLVAAVLMWLILNVFGG